MTDTAASGIGTALRVVRADYANPDHARALVAMLDAYAQDPLDPAMGGAQFLQKWLD